MKDKQKYIKGLFLCYSYSKKNTRIVKPIDLEIIKLTDDIIGQLSKYDLEIIKEYFFEDKSLSNIAVNLHYKSHTSIYVKVNEIIAKIKINN